jgi:hypothetical protein
MAEAGPKQQQLNKLRLQKLARAKQKAKEEALALREAMVTELRGKVADVTKKIARAVTEKKRGRPPTGQAMSGAERIRRLRERRKA